MKKVFLLALCFFLAGAIIAIAGAQKEAEEAAKPIAVKIAYAQPPETPRHKSLLKFKEMLEQRSNGAFVVELYHSGQLGTEAEMTDQVKLGTIQACRSGSFEKVEPKLLIYTMPFLFKEIKGIQKITRGPIGEKIVKDAEKNGVIVLATGDAGPFRHFTNNVRPIKTPDDMVGLKMRTPPIDSIIKIMEAIGANPVSIAYAEVYMALKTGVADGEENPFINIEAMKFHEVQKYCTVVNYQYHPEPFFFNPDWYHSLSPEHQKIVKEVAKETMIINDNLMEEATQRAYNLIKDSMEFYVLSNAERQVFIDKTKSVPDYYIKKGLFTREELEEIRRIAGE